MSSQTKKLGCMALKEMIEGDKLILNDFDIIAEISTFIAKGGSYEASSGYHDDLISTLVMFGWLSTQPYYKELVNIDVRKRLYEEKLKQLENDLMPFGYIDGGEDIDDSVRELAKEDSDVKKQRNDRSWLSDAEEIF
jgi:hypothetical protein